MPHRSIAHIISQQTPVTATAYLTVREACQRMAAPYGQALLELSPVRSLTPDQAAELLQAQTANAEDAAQHTASVEDTVMQRAEQTLRAYRRACQSAGHTRRGRGNVRRSAR